MIKMTPLSTVIMVPFWPPDAFPVLEAIRLPEFSPRMTKITITVKTSFIMINDHQAQPEADQDFHPRYGE